MAKIPDWSDAELEVLDTLANKYPTKEMVRKYKKIAQDKGFPLRTDMAIAQRVYRLYGSTRATEDNYCAREFANILGISRGRVAYWIESGKLETQRVGWLHKISKRSVLKFIREYPEFLSDATWEGIAYVSDSATANRIKELPTTRKPPLMVRDKRSGLTYPSIRDAARKTGVATATIRRHLQKEVGKWLLLG